MCNLDCGASEEPSDAVQPIVRTDGAERVEPFIGTAGEGYAWPPMITGA
jgi:hypothetical protein